MTNEHRVRELCRAIRGIADTYPSGFGDIVRQVREIEHKQAQAYFGSHGKREWASYEVLDAEGVAVRQTSQPNDPPNPKANRHSGQAPRKRGRPRKQRAEP